MRSNRREAHNVVGLAVGGWRWRARHSTYTWRVERQSRPARSSALGWRPTSMPEWKAAEDAALRELAECLGIADIPDLRPAAAMRLALARIQSLEAIVDELRGPGEDAATLQRRALERIKELEARGHAS